MQRTRCWPAFCLLVLACADPTPTGRGILARVGGELPLGTGEVSTRARELDGDWRHVPDDALSDVLVPDRADTLAWSCGGNEGGGFRIELRDDEGPWRLLEAGSLETAGRWLDYDRALPPGRSRHLRFRALAEGDGEPPDFGSIRFLGPVDAPRRPDVLLLSLDTLGAGHLGTYGGPPGVSPRIDAFLASSIAFDRAYAQYGNTLVSHSSLFSAFHPIRHGDDGRGSRQRLDQSLLDVIAASGYEMLAFTDGGYVSASFGFDRSFDHYRDGRPGPAWKWRPGAAFEAALDHLAARTRDEPLFLFVHTYEVHNPYLPRDEKAVAFAGALTPGDDRLFSASEQRRLLRRHARAGRLPPERDLRRLEALHRAEIHALDARLAAFLTAIDQQLDAPIIVLLSDHGEQFGEWGRIRHGSSLHDRVIHVPLAFRVPGLQPRTVEVPVQLVDVMPTLLELLGLPIPDGRDGRSLAAWLRGGQSSARPAFAQQGRDNWRCDRDVSDCRVDRVAVVTERFKLVDEQHPESRRHLYDLHDDPGEESDVADRYPADVEQLSALALEYRARAEQPSEETPADAGPDAATRERLRALGYEEGDP